MAEGLKVPPITQLEFSGDDFDDAERIARHLGYTQTAYTSTSALWGLFCLADNPANTAIVRRRRLPPYVDGCIIKTQQFGLMFVQTAEDLRLDAHGRRER